ncbi:protein TOPLESS-RELATED PROTEIN 2-like isoform X2 [Humulus lupulus]|uniref:protein TOPLESS-RELATED PROTEIN 2-like isoform X2 n=1 Tax=Humulus lupulus TaxID=3486 RepID=UPI002B40284B|nr:protein TOPLESS-RELATED PROTEIN 2-like isoform X2 [Humulus lupulus]
MGQEAWYSANALAKRFRYESASNLPIYPQRPGEKDCVHYMQTRTCKFGDSCKFDHAIWVLEGGIPDWKELAPGQVSLFHLSSSPFQRFGFASFASPETSEKEHGSNLENNGDAKVSSQAASEQSDVVDQTKESDSDEDLSVDDLVKLVAEKEELLKQKHKEIEKMQDKVLRSYAEMENLMDKTRRESENSKKFEKIAMIDCLVFIYFCCLYHINRQNEQLSKYGDTKSARNIMLIELKKLIEANPLFRDKLTFPAFKSSRLRTLINQSLNWQHKLCKNPRPNPDIKTLFTDHSCNPTTNGSRPPPTNNLVGPIPKAGAFPPIGAHGPFQPVESPSPSTIAGWMSNSNSSLSHPVVAAPPPGLVQQSSAAAFLKHPRTPTGVTGMDYQSADSEHLIRRIRTGQSDKVSFSGVMHSGAYSQDDIPKNLVRTLSQGSNVMSMDFHPQQQTILLVGTNVGDISLWEVGSRERMVHKPFNVWDIQSASMPLQSALLSDAGISVNRCVWGSDGLMLGVAFSKHIVQIYTYNTTGELRQHLEIDAHVGGVNDIAFAHPNKQHCIVTCGDDKMIKVWDAVSGRRLYIFEGHEAPVYSVCPHYKENIQFIFSIAIDEKIKAWLYDCLGSRVDYDAPGLWCTMMAYSADGTRLFSCGTSKEGESHLVEWNESEAAIKRTYSGFRKRSLGVVQFDTTRNRFLAAGDEFQIKFWDMDSTNMLTAIDADGGLPASPRLRFNKEGSLLAVTTNDNGIKILANNDGLRLIRMLESRAMDKNRGPSEPINSKCGGKNTYTLGEINEIRNE